MKWNTNFKVVTNMFDPNSLYLNDIWYIGTNFNFGLGGVSGLGHLWSKCTKANGSWRTTSY